MSQTDSRNCTLALNAEGRTEACRRERCAFWEPGGAVLPGTCLIERIGVDVRETGLAKYLLETRRRLDDARDLAEAEAARLEFARRLGPQL
jgi:hypothetical protein